MNIVLILAVAVVFFKIVLPFLFAMFQLLMTPVYLFWRIVWEAKWFLLAAFVLLIILSALGVFG